MKTDWCMEARWGIKASRQRFWLVSRAYRLRLWSMERFRLDRTLCAISPIRVCAVEVYSIKWFKCTLTIYSKPTYLGSMTIENKFFLTHFCLEYGNTSFLPK